MTKEYQITSRSRAKYFFKILGRIVLFLVVTIVAYITYKGIKDPALLLSMVLGAVLIWSIIYLLPLVVLFLNHSRHSRSVVLRYNVDTGDFYYSSDKAVVNFAMQDIVNVKLYLTTVAYSNFVDWQFFGKYHYVALEIEDKGILRVSCLVLDEAEVIFSESIIEKKKKFLPLIL